MVGGGGAGYKLIGAGGSAGNLIYASNVLLSSNVIYDIIVGKGGNSLNNGGDTIAFGSTIKGGKNASGIDGTTGNFNNIISPLITSASFLINKITKGGGSGIPISTAYLSPHSNIDTGTVSINTVSGNNMYYYYSFTNNGSIKFSQNTNCDVLLVGGGGAGGVNIGGGSSGGILYYTNVLITSNTNYPIVVGAGGITAGANGDNSSVFNATAVGGRGATTKSGALGSGTNTVGGLLSSGNIGCNLTAISSSSFITSTNIYGGGAGINSIEKPQNVIALNGGSYLEHSQVSGNSNYYYYAFTSNFWSKIYRIYKKYYL